MPRLQSANNAETTLVAGISPSAVTFQVADATNFPSAPFRISVNAEIMEVGSIDKPTNTFSNVLRGREGTVAANHLAGTSVQNRFTSGTYGELVSTNELQSATNQIQSEIDAVETEVNTLETTVNNNLTSNKPRLYRSKTTNQVIPTANTWTAVSFDKSFEQNKLNTNGATHIIQEDGLYLITAAVNFSGVIADGSNSYVLGSFAINSRLYRFGGVHSNSTGNISVNGSIMMNLTAGTTIQVEVFTGGANATVVGLTTEERTYVMIRKL